MTMLTQHFFEFIYLIQTIIKRLRNSADRCACLLLLSFFAGPAFAQDTSQWRPNLIIGLLVILIVVLSYVVYRILPLYSRNKTKATHLAGQLEALEAETERNAELTLLLNNIFESSLNGIIAFDSMRNLKNEIVDLRFARVNQAACDIIGAEPKGLVGNTMLSVFPGNVETGLYDAYLKVIKEGIPFTTVMHYEHDGLDKWFSISAVKNDDGLVVTFSDVSPLKKNEQQLLKSQQDLEDVNVELEQFAYIASHDLQEPLRKIRAFGDRLEANFASLLGEKGSDYISRMQNAAARMQILIDDLLSYSRTTKGLQNEDNIELNSVLDTVVGLLDESISAQKAEIKIEKLPLILGNHSQLVQLFLNLMSNALKYSDNEVTPHIEIECESVEQVVNNVQEQFYEISLRDNGIGFDNAHRDKIFEIFQRLHSRTEYQGTGIGLAICQKIVNNHGGYIYAKSEEARGAVFTVGFPVPQK